ncbi:MAG TPA: FecR domain-containing protein [Terriglobales bacterium]|nr:FecR domain-containing protein [Terriglobales bacterium]
MSEEVGRYLWDGSGVPDPEVARLEQLLGRYRYDAPLRPLPTRAPSRRPRLVLAFALASAALLACVVLLASLRFRWQPGAAWAVEAVSGAPQLDGKRLRESGRLGVGQELVTDADSRARIRVARIGVVEVEPNSRVRLLATTSNHHRIELERGKIRARTWAPPFTFAVDTPSAQAYDVGCAYTLEVDEHGNGLLLVTSGWVELEGDEWETMVPEGAAAESRPGVGPGSSYYQDASPAFKTALREINFGPGSGPAHQAALSTLLQQARKRDLITLLNLMLRLPPQERGQVYDRAAQLSPPPPGVTRDAVVRGEHMALEPWWQNLGLGNVKRWWIYWKDALML